MSSISSPRWSNVIGCSAVTSKLCSPTPARGISNGEVQPTSGSPPSIEHSK